MSVDFGSPGPPLNRTSKLEDDWKSWELFLEFKTRELAKEGAKYQERSDRRREYSETFEEAESYLSRLRGIGSKPTAGSSGFGPMVHSTVHWKILKILRDRDELSRLSSDGLLSTASRMKGVIQGVYDIGDYNQTLQQFLDLAKSDRPASKDFPLFEFLFAYFPGLFFKSRDIGDVLDVGGPGGPKHWRFLRELIGYIDSFSAYHEFMHFTSKWYRDHLLHSIRVMWLMRKLMGEWKELYRRSTVRRLQDLLNRAMPSRRISIISPDDRRAIKAIASLSPESSQSIENEIFLSFEDLATVHRVDYEGETNAMLAGLLHDLLYPLQSMLRKEKPSEEGLSSSEVNTFRSVLQKENEDRTLDLLTSGDVRMLEDVSRIAVPFIKERFLRGDLKLALQSLGDGIFQSLEDVYNKREPAVNTDTLKRALRSGNHAVLGAMLLKALPLETRQAIALHDAKIVPVEIDPLKMPITFFLVLCDEAQEWGRRVLCDDGKRYEVPCEDAEARIDSNVFSVKFDFDKKIERVRECKPKFNVDEIIRDKYKNLSRLRADKNLGLTIEFRMIWKNKEHFVKFVDGEWQTCECHSPEC